MKNSPRLDSQITGRIILVLALFAFFSALESSFATGANIYTVLEGFAFTGLVALAIGITIIAGEMDLSVGSMAAVAGVIAVSFAGLGLVYAVLLAVLVAATLGSLQGIAIGLLRIPSIVFTVGTMIGLRGLVYILSGEKTVVVPDLNRVEVIRHPVSVFSLFSLITIGMFMLMGLFMNYSRPGRNVYAIGGGRAEAAAAGVPIFRTIVLIFTVSGLLAGLAGALVCLKSGSASPHGLDGLLLLAAAAALIGGTSLSGGRGTVFGIALGAIAIRFVSSYINFKAMPYYAENLAIGGLLILIIAVELLMAKRGRPVGAIDFNA
jgi:ribose/xylose/arabinose/galactoside ABC-type transport system permease subunit